MTSKPQSCELKYYLMENNPIKLNYDIICVQTQYGIDSRIRTKITEIGRVLELDNSNPLIELDMPIGIVGLVKIIQLVQTEKNKPFEPA